MTAANHGLTIEQGATFQFVITYRDSAGVLVNLTNYTARMQVRERVSSTTTLLDISTDDYITLGGGAGTLTISVPPVITAAMDFTRGVYDIEIESGSGVVTRLLQGDVEFSKEVTR